MAGGAAAGGEGWRTASALMRVRRSSTVDTASSAQPPSFARDGFDAGSGADRVIGEFARQYVLTNPRAVHEMRLGGAGEEPQSTSDESDGGAEDKYAGVDKAARDGVYALLYSVTA